jgi:hypothetical protein
MSDIVKPMDIFKQCGMLSFNSNKDEFCAWRKKIMTAVKLTRLSDIVVYNPISSAIQSNKDDSKVEVEAESRSKSKNSKDVEHKALLAYSLILNLLDSKLTKQMDSIWFNGGVK